MIQLDLISKRIIVIAVSISVVLLFAIFFIKTATPAKAQTIDRTYEAIAGNSAGPLSHFFIWNTKTGTYRVISSMSSSSDTRNW
ncbi:MAG: hypothetical protein FWD13_00840 [Treponema sp.]|nr:hypothetical protein [Treponema sp.]